MSCAGCNRPAGATTTAWDCVDSDYAHTHFCTETCAREYFAPLGIECRMIGAEQLIGPKRAGDTDREPAALKRARAIQLARILSTDLEFVADVLQKLIDELSRLGDTHAYDSTPIKRVLARAQALITDATLKVRDYADEHDGGGDNEEQQHADANIDSRGVIRALRELLTKIREIQRRLAAHRKSERFDERDPLDVGNVRQTSDVYLALLRALGVTIGRVRADIVEREFVPLLETLSRDADSRIALLPSDVTRATKRYVAGNEPPAAQQRSYGIANAISEPSSTTTKSVRVAPHEQYVLAVLADARYACLIDAPLERYRNAERGDYVLPASVVLPLRAHFSQQQQQQKIGVKRRGDVVDDSGPLPLPPATYAATVPLELDDLPNEVLAQILANLDLMALMRVARTNRRFASLAHDRHLFVAAVQRSDASQLERAMIRTSDVLHLALRNQRPIDELGPYGDHDVVMALVNAALALAARAQHIVGERGVLLTEVARMSIPVAQAALESLTRGMCALMELMLGVTPPAYAIYTPLVAAAVPPHPLVRTASAVVPLLAAHLLPTRASLSRSPRYSTLLFTTLQAAVQLERYAAHTGGDTRFLAYVVYTYFMTQLAPGEYVGVSGILLESTHAFGSVALVCEAFMQAGYPEYVAWLRREENAIQQALAPSWISVLSFFERNMWTPAMRGASAVVQVADYTAQVRLARKLVAFERRTPTHHPFMDYATRVHASFMYAITNGGASAPLLTAMIDEQMRLLREDVPDWRIVPMYFLRYLLVRDWLVECDAAIRLVAAHNDWHSIVATATHEQWSEALKRCATEWNDHLMAVHADVADFMLDADAEQQLLNGIQRESDIFHAKWRALLRTPYVADAARDIAQQPMTHEQFMRGS